MRHQLCGSCATARNPACSAYSCVPCLLLQTAVALAVEAAIARAEHLATQARPRPRVVRWLPARPRTAAC